MTWAIISGFFGNIWVRRALLVVVLLIAWGFVKRHYIDQGKQQGKQEAGQTVKQETHETVTAARTDLVQKQDQHQAIIDSLQRQANASKSKAAQFAHEAAVARQERDDAQRQLSGTRDADLHPFIVANLKRRRPDDLTPGYLPAEEREIAQCLVDRTGCTKENEGLAAQIKQLQAQIDKLEDRDKERQGELKDLASFTQTVEHAYVEIYNAFPKKTNRLLWVVTLGHKGKEKQLPFPDPKVLLGRTAGKQESK